ncbi:phosphodiesterase [candidate division MSBL1 archaeon SCGC-AAA259E19]|uniref:Phosphoesterase n=2 Tax=candidate division MSBL1 TaxID=215777 RepID=A0A133V5C9_9EURY|nr:phosphodiesterase [candidate division MSBL1 archaeon SCGC-AAA259E19]KXB01606.1 phosphodiesterase [candidate division MSBL1 archaeon SCGC-AAA259O05]
MKVGLMADTHDNLEATERAVDLFNEEKVEHVLHAGDLVSPFVVSKLSNLDAELHFVWGNNEGDRGHIRENFEEIGVSPAGEFASVNLAGRRIALLHGKDEEIVEALAGSGKYDLVVRGHTHSPGIEKEPLIVNPGATSGYLTDHETVALLDTEEMRPEIVKI